VLKAFSQEHFFTLNLFLAKIPEVNLMKMYSNEFSGEILYYA